MPIMDWHIFEGSSESKSRRKQKWTVLANYDLRRKHHFPTFPVAHQHSIVGPIRLLDGQMSWNHVGGSNNRLNAMNWGCDWVPQPQPLQQQKSAITTAAAATMPEKLPSNTHCFAPHPTQTLVLQIYYFRACLAESAHNFHSRPGQPA